MGLPAINVELGDLGPYLIERGLQVFGIDSVTSELREWFSDLQRRSLVDASLVQIVGMQAPIPLLQIYQPTRLICPLRQLKKPGENFTVAPEGVLSAEDFLHERSNALIFAGPGWGKTTFFRYLFVRLAKDKEIVPVLFTLRRSTAIDDLERFVRELDPLSKAKRKATFLLLLDGYDEVPEQDRKRVSEAAIKFTSMNLGFYALTCRDFYDVYELSATHVRVAAFDDNDQLQFVSSFLKSYGTNSNAHEVISDLKSQGFDDFLKHPLLLALACIVKSGQLSLRSRSVIKLLELALDTLAFRWDQLKGISRTSSQRIDGKDRLRCLMRIAYESDGSPVPCENAIAFAQQQLDLMGYEGLDAEAVLLECARFYGILVPATFDEWQFVHQTLCDYLAARFWVESGNFSARSVTAWNTRASYAACLSPNATIALQRTLKQHIDLSAFAEMLGNEAPFEHDVIARELIHYYETKGTPLFPPPNRIVAELQPDFVSLASSKFLICVVSECLNRDRSSVIDSILTYALAGLRTRHHQLSESLYQRLIERFRDPQFAFTFVRAKYDSFILEQLCPSGPPEVWIG
jgi:hypothetical protein